jgi:putative oxidoreductase
MVEMSPSTALLTRTAEVPRPRTEQSAPPTPRPSRMPGAELVDRAVALNERYAATLLRLALAGVFVWFGALKVAGVSPVHDLIAATLPWFDADITVPALGAVEIAIGLVLALGIFPRVTLLVLISAALLLIAVYSRRQRGSGTV